VTTITIGKLEAAQRQLRTAITLWFDDGDAVSVHTLAFAAYEIFHAVSEHRDPYRRDLLFDTLLIKDEFRRDWNKLVRREANFFKHGDRDAEAVIDFDPDLSEWFILYAIVARQLLIIRRATASTTCRPSSSRSTSTRKLLWVIGGTS